MLLVVLAAIPMGLRELLAGVVPSSVLPVYGYVVWYFPIVLFSAMPIAFSYTILTRRVFGIRFIIRKGLQHLLVSKGALLIGWLLVFWVVHQVLSHSNRWSDSVSAVSALAVGAAFVGTVGLRRVNVRLMRTIDRRFFREALDVRLMLSQLSGQLADLREGDKIHRLVASQVLAALHPSRVILLQRGQGEGDMESALVLESDRRSPSHEVRSPTSRISEAPVLLRSNDAAVQQVERDGWAAVAPETLDPQVEEESRLLQTGCELLIAIPASTGLIGVMGLGPKLSEEPFSGEDRDLLLTVARQAGMALENAELVEVAKREAQHAKELEIARNVQQNLFPRELPPREGWQFAAVCRPARAVGGDYYDVFEIDPTRVGLAIGDVSGKGLGPALMMSSIHAMTRSGLPPMAAEPSRFVESLNKHLVGSTSAEMFATFFVGVLDTTTGGLRYVNAGHNPPILLAGSSSEVSRLTDAGLIVGALSGVKYTDADMHMGDGDLLVLFSDGITEAMNKTGEMFEEERLLKEVIKARDCGRASEILSSIVDAVDRFAGEAEQADDMSVVVVMRNSCDHRPEAR
jgi:sigma-B regulation protein RsbU (phosphoserine phosphatase)